MYSTNFDQTTPDKFNRVLSFALDNVHSSLYRDLYTGKNVPSAVSSYEDFLTLPLLSKNNFLAYPLEQRTFVPKENIKYFSFSSGTTQSKKVTVVPHDSFYLDTIGLWFDEKEITTCGARKLLLMLPVSAPVYIRTTAVEKKDIILTSVDINNLPLAAQIANETKTEGLVTTATILDHFAKELRALNFDFLSIRWVSLGSEYCSQAKHEYFKTVFPNAYFKFRFGTSEIGGRGYRCDHLKDMSPNTFHPIPNTLVEVVDEHGAVLPMGELGELVHTHLSAKAFPAIRYRTNDIGTLQKTDCPCGNNYLLTLGGRADFDILKFSGVVLNTEAIASAVATASEFVESVFQMHVYEEQSQGSLKPKLSLHLKVKTAYLGSVNDATIKKLIAEKISNELWLSSRSTLKSLIDQGVFLPLEVILLDEIPTTSHKSRNIISHLQ